MALGPWRTRRPQDTRAVIAVIDLTHYIPPSPGFARLSAAGAPIRYPNLNGHGPIRGRVASPYIESVDPDGNLGHLLIITDLTDIELNRAFPHGYIPDPDF